MESARRSGPVALRRFRIFTPLCIAFLSACTLPAPRLADTVLEQRWTEHAGQAKQIQAWDLRARFAVRSDDQGGQATLSWQRTPERQFIQINGPLGRGVVRITQDAQGAHLVDAERREFSATSAEELLQLYTGWHLPVNHLDWWVRGLPVPEVRAQRELDDQGRLRVLHQAEWEISYSEYLQVEQAGLPRRFTLARAATDFSPALEVRFVIERWAGLVRR